MKIFNPFKFIKTRIQNMLLKLFLKYVSKRSGAVVIKLKR